MAKITIEEIRELLKQEKIQPSQLFSKEALEGDPIVELLAIKEIRRQEKQDKKETSESNENDSMIPD